MSEEKDLQQILEELGAYCAIHSLQPIKIKVVLPKDVLLKFSKSFEPIARLPEVLNKNSIKESKEDHALMVKSYVTRDCAAIDLEYYD